MQKRAQGIFCRRNGAHMAWSPVSKTAMLDEKTWEIQNVIGLRGLSESAAKTHGLCESRRISCQTRHSIDCGEAGSVSFFFARSSSLQPVRQRPCCLSPNGAQCN